MNQPVDLVSLVLTLQPQDTPALHDPSHPCPAWWGRAAHALLLHTVQLSNPALAEQLHAASGIRPFTVSTLMGHFPNKSLDPAQTYTLRFTATRTDLAHLLLEAVQPGGALAPQAVIELDFLPFTILSTTVHPVEQPWAGQSSYQQLGAQYLLGAPAPRQVGLQFTSPTGFHQDGKQIALPLPGLVFGSLLERWNAASPMVFPPELRRYAEECLTPARFELESRAVPGKENTLRVGCVGQVLFTTIHYDRYWMSLVHTLAAFARFSGVGAGTSQGMGQARRLEPAHPAGEG